MNKIALIIACFVIVLCGFHTSPEINYSAPDNELLDSLLSNNESLNNVWKNTDIHRLQIIYTRILRDGLGNIKLQNYSYNSSENE